MPYQTEFETNLRKFLTDYGVQVAGGMASPTASGGGALVSDLLAAAHFRTTQRTGGAAATSGVSLAAPLVTARFAERLAAENTQYFDFSVPLVEVTLDTYGGAADLPVYLIPYEGGKARGVKLPAHGSDHHAVAYAMTATQNGCTVEVSGDTASPYVSHTNVIDVDGSDAQQKWIARQQKMNARLFKLQQRFVDAEFDARGNASAPGERRTQFAFYDNDPQRGVSGARDVNYTTRAQAILEDLAAHGVKTRRQEDSRIGHDRYYCVPSDDTLTEMRRRVYAPNALVVGRRDASGWRFFYQIYTSMGFYVYRVSKLAGFKLGGGEFITRANDATKRKRFGALVVLSTGQLWPNVSERPCTFGLGT